MLTRSLVSSTARGRSFWARLVIFLGADIDTQGEDDRRRRHPVLNIAIARGMTTLARRLIASGADVNAIDSVGFTALHWAAETGNVEMLPVLLADVSIDKDKVTAPNLGGISGLTALHVASAKSHEHFGGLLVDADASVNLGDSYGRTILHYVIARKQYRLLDKVIGREDIDLTVTDTRGYTPLHFAILFGNHRAVQILGDRLTATALSIRTSEVFESQLSGLIIARQQTPIDLLRVCIARVGSTDIDGENPYEVIEPYLKAKFGKDLFTRFTTPKTDTATAPSSTARPRVERAMPSVVNPQTDIGMAVAARSKQTQEFFVCFSSLLGRQLETWRLISQGAIDIQFGGESVLKWGAGATQIPGAEAFVSGIMGIYKFKRKSDIEAILQQGYIGLCNPYEDAKKLAGMIISLYPTVFSEVPKRQCREKSRLAGVLAGMFHKTDTSLSEDLAFRLNEVVIEKIVRRALLDDISLPKQLFMFVTRAFGEIMVGVRDLRLSPKANGEIRFLSQRFSKDDMVGDDIRRVLNILSKRDAALRSVIGAGQDSHATFAGDLPDASTAMPEDIELGNNMRSPRPPHPRRPSLAAGRYSSGDFEPSFP